MIRLLGDFLVFVVPILGILLIIGLIKPSLVSNIMKRLPDPIGEFFEKVNNRKKILLVYGVSCLLLMIIGPTLSPVEHFETGKKYYEKEDWAGAVNNLSKVSTDDENYAEALELLSVAKENRTREQAEEILSGAKTSFEEKKWSEVIDLLSDFPKDHSLTKEVNKLLTNAKEKRFEEEGEEVVENAKMAFEEKNWDKVNELLSGFPKDHPLTNEANTLLKTSKEIQKNLVLQEEFEIKRNSFREDYSDAPNEIKKSAIWVEANEWTRQFGRSRGWKINNWYGTIEDLSTDQGGDFLTLSISSRKFGTRIDYETWNNRFSDMDDNTMPKKGSKIYNQAAELLEGDYVYFSAELLSDSEKGIKESSMTESGSLRAPEFKVRFTDIRPEIGSETETPADDSETQGTVESSSKKSSFTQLLHEYGDLLDDYADIMKKVSEGDLSAMSEMMSITEKVTKWMEKWEKELEASNDDLSPSDLADIMKEYQRLLERYQEIVSNM